MSRGEILTDPRADTGCHTGRRSDKRAAQRPCVSAEAKGFLDAESAPMVDFPLSGGVV